jgi:ABC-type multidrug transport system fused ATPase/permease subunit
MFVRPFLKYFRPFVSRIAIAIVGMIVVGALSATPLLIGREAIRVLLGNSRARMVELQNSGQITPEMKALLKGYMPDLSSESQGDGSKALPRKDPLGRVDEWRKAHSDRAWSVPVGWGLAVAKTIRGWYGATLEPPVARVQAWYRRQAAQNPLHALGCLVAILITLTAISGIGEFTSRYHLTHVFFFADLRIREDIFRNVMRQDYLYFSQNSAGYLYSRICSDAKDLCGIMESLLSDGIQQPLTLVSMLVVLFWLSWQLTIVVMLILPVIGVLLYYFANVLRKNMRKQKKQADALSSCMTESLSNIRLVKAFGAEAIESSKFHEHSMALFRFMMARRLAKYGSSPLMAFLGTVVVGGVIMFGGWMIMATPPKMPFADFVIYLATLSRFYRPIGNIANLTNKYQGARVSAERMRQMLLIEPEIVEDPAPVPFEHLSDAIEFRDVCFAYGHGRVLDGVNLRVPVGRSVGFAGPSGAGKTTLINLLVRLFDPEAGRILIDGTDLRRVRVKDWRRRLAIVSQDTYLFDDTFANNIAYGVGTVDRRRVEEAARAANAHDFIMAMGGGKGYDTKIGPMGARLSGGQRQRLAIARAIYRDPAILVLDEATSALDSQSQALVQEALAKLMAGRTTFIVAHRISTIRDVDCIHVLADGRIVESGTYDALMASGGIFASMARHGLADAPAASNGAAGNGYDKATLAGAGVAAVGVECRPCS